MFYEEQFRNELAHRDGLDGQFVVEVRCSSDDEALRAKWAADLPKLGKKWSKYRFGIVMPAGQRNLAVVLLQERVDLPLVVVIFTSLGRALAHVHAAGKLHGDFKLLNLVRMPDGTWRIIDLDGAVAIGAPIGAKALSTAFMPPEATHLAGDEVLFRVPKKGAPTPYELLPAHPTLDLWSFFVVLVSVGWSSCWFVV